MQSLIVIDMIYTIDILLKDLAEKNNKFFLVKALLAILAVIGAVVLNVLSYLHHRETADSLYISILNSIYIGIFLLVAIGHVVKGHTLLVYGLVMVYSNLIGYYLHCPA